jgi:heptosyltransferase II
VAGDLKNILIVSTTGLGDTIWGTPAIQALAKSLPDAKITVLTNEVGAELLKENKDVQKTIICKDPIIKSFMRLYREMREIPFDAVLIFHISQRLIMPLCALTNAPVIIGTRGINKGLDTLLTKVLPQNYQHEIERRIDIANALTPVESDGLLHIPLTQEEARPFCQEKLIGIHPGSKDQFKRWGKKHFIAIGKHLSETVDAKILITGNESESELAEEIAAAIPGAVSVAGRLPLRRFAGVVKECSLFITNDTGPMHLAYAFSTPTVALFCATDANLCGPHKAKNAIVMQRDKTCTPCLMKKCRDAFCLEQISPEEVIEAINTLRHNKEPRC